MKRVVIIVVTFVLSAMLYGCRPPVGGDSEVSKSFLRGLLYAREIDLWVDQYNSGVIRVVFNGYYLTDERKENALKTIGDVSYNKKVYIGVLDQRSAICYDLVSINVVSSAQFGDVAPGRPLASKIVYSALSIKPYIDSGYTMFGDWDAIAGQESGFWNSMEVGYAEWTPIVKPLTEVTIDDMKLLATTWGMALSFTEVPEVKEHTFTVTIADEWGHVMTASVDYVFE
jgi:hypothetical protein